MSTALHHRNDHLRTVIDRDAVLTEMEGILSSTHFCNSKRYPALLKYVVEETLAGREDTLKERTIGVEVFDRPAAYDTNADTVVRFTAGEVRKRLAAYYHDRVRTTGLRISLPLGTYVPDFSIEREPEITHGQDRSGKADLADTPDLMEATDVRVTVSAGSPSDTPPDGSAGLVDSGRAALIQRPEVAGRRFLLPAAAGFVLLLSALTFWFLPRETTLAQFWRPFLHDRRTVLLCAGGNTLAQSQNPTLITADKLTAYPYFSLQTTISIAQLSNFIQRNGGTPAFNFAASTPLPELHSHAIILVNAYNNPWTLRLVEPLRFYFSPDTGAISDQSIVDRNSAVTHWKRDLSVPDSDTDDYALVARFWDTVTNNWVLVLAGLGRNGTEAASQFVTDSQYTQLLHDRIGDLGGRNVEVVLKVNVIDGKTGSPSIVATHVW